MIDERIRTLQQALAVADAEIARRSGIGAWKALADAAKDLVLERDLADRLAEALRLADAHWTCDRTKAALAVYDAARRV